LFSRRYSTANNFPRLRKGVGILVLLSPCAHGRRVFLAAFRSSVLLARRIYYKADIIACRTLIRFFLFLSSLCWLSLSRHCLDKYYMKQNSSIQFCSLHRRSKGRPTPVGAIVSRDGVVFASSAVTASSSSFQLAADAGNTHVIK
jgi:hypothetical protein